MAESARVGIVGSSPGRGGAGKAILSLGVFLALCFGAAAIGGMSTASSVGEWYPTLAKPSWTPPSWLFGPVWTLLYAMMAVAGWLVWRKSEGSARTAMAAFGIQLALNVLWSVLFFGQRQPGVAFLELVLLWGAILVTALLFRKHSTVAAALLLPYLAWVTFAGALNWSIWRLNS